MKLGLGTAQFGLDYGVSNRLGRPTEDEARAIVQAAATAGVSVVDTAPAYGESEAVLGRVLDGHEAFSVVTKTVPGVADSRSVLHALNASLNRLGRKNVYGVLAHHAEDAIGEKGKAVIEGLREAKSRGLVEKIGVSVYTASDIDSILKNFVPDIVQLPANVFDQRLIRSGHVSELKRRGVEIHVRSVFLQGLLLMSPIDVPANLSEARGPVERFDSACRTAGRSRLAGALSFALGNPDFDCVLVGVASLAELTGVLEAAKSAVSLDFSAFEVHDERILSPTRWNRG